MQMLSPVQVQEKLVELYTVCASANAYILDEAKRIPISMNPSFVFPEEEETDIYNIYDNYFGVARADDLSFALFLHQYINIFSLTVEDLANALISLEELSRLITGFNEMAKYMISTIDPANKIDYKELPLVSVQPTEYNNVSDSAISKWKIQHYAFNISMLFSTETLTQAIQALKKNEFARASELIFTSSITLRSSTSAMWSASAFTSEIYKKIVRPSMESTKSPGGFSGNQNREFETWRIVKDSFREWLQENLDKIGPLKNSLRYWVDTYVFDMLQHILVADAMRVDGSMVDEDMEKNFGFKTGRRAVDALQHLLELRKKEFDFLFK